MDTQLNERTNQNLIKVPYLLGNEITDIKLQGLVLHQPDVPSLPAFYSLLELYHMSLNPQVCIRGAATLILPSLEKI